ncbi:MAG TPA: hypothetical protein VHS58_22180, partial [Acetobacteraceae bacterium]|nr:hypothetical protein [Acetobacteraceae bacterium]
MPRGWLLAILLLCAPLGPAAAQPSAPASSRAGPPSTDPSLCEAPSDLTETAANFPMVAAALQPGHSLDILAVGSATMLGPDRSTDASFPAVAAAMLRVAIPAASVMLTVRSGRGMTAADMLPIMREALMRRHFQLVIWQTGTVEAVRGLPPDDFLQTLDEVVR